ncbi:MAG: LuxR family maltose regulon positive regulatory protein [Verrucomicrobiales bacterium]|jgi:LuxR family maltose regulon positive regulatory protein
MLPAQTVPREQLIRELSSSDAALTAIVAPPGYGKTTAAVQLIHSLGDPVAWLSLESADANPARFWTYVAAALSAAGVPGADQTYDHLSTGGVDAAILALRSAVEAAGDKYLLVLDDMHLIESEVIEQQLGDWLRRPVPNLRIICTSRSDLGLPVGRLRSQGLLTEARIAELAFSGEESEMLLRSAFGLSNLTVAQLERLDSRTEGWPVGLYLAGLTLRDDPDIDAQLERFAGDTRHLTEYLAVEAMDGVTDDVRAFVLATSIVSVLDPDLCDALTGQIGSLKVLRGLVAENVFTSALDEAATVFHYHPLFREHLRSALAADHPEQLAELHRRASLWFEARGDVHEAVLHASAGADIRRAETLITSSSSLFSNAGHFDTVIDWVDGLGPPENLRTETCLLMSWTMLNLRRYDELEQWMDSALAAADTDIEQEVLRTQLPTIRSHKARHIGDLGQMLHWANDALAQESSYPRSEDVGGLFVRIDSGRGAASSAAGCAAFWDGDLDRSHDLFAAGLEIARPSNMLIEVIFCYGYLAMIEAERGDPEGALAHADQALSMIGSADERQLQPTLSYLARSIAKLALGLPADAKEDLDRARELAADHREPLHDAAIDLQDARILHRTGDIDGARAALRGAKAAIGAMPDPHFEKRVRAVEAEIRFVARDVEDLPIGARELTDREQAVLVLLPHRLPRKELAEQLHVSENTIKTHLTSIRHKLGIHGRESIVERANELGLLGPVETAS